MNSDPTLSSEQALDDYFTSLLSEDDDAQDSDEEALAASPEPQLLPQRVIEPEPSFSRFLDDDIEELPGANLDEVQRLLSQLEGSNPVDDLNLDEVLEQNTLNIAQEASNLAKPDDAPVTDSVQTAFVEDEIQEWDTATLTEDQEGEPHFHEQPTAVDDTNVEPMIDEATSPTIEVVAQEDESSLAACAQPSESDIELEKNAAIVDNNTDEKTDLSTSSQHGLDSESWTNPIRQEAFQVLYFDVNDVTFAVPLDELGGINQLGEPSHLIGRPNWYLGLQTQREQQLDVVDTAKWVMADKLKDDGHRDAYQYIVMLGESMWGLACTKLMGTEWLNAEKIRWREQVGKRPWLAGMVKEKMCALIHVDALIAMLNAGLDVKALDK